MIKNMARNLSSKKSSHNNHTYLFSKDNIRMDREILFEGDTVCAYIEIWFDVEQKFGIRLSDDYNIDVYAYISPATDDVRIVFTISNSDGDTESEKEYTELTLCEKDLIQKMADEICLAETGMTVYQYWHYLKNRTL